MRTFEGPCLPKSSVVVIKGVHAGETGVVTDIGKNSNIRYVKLDGSEKPIPLLASELQQVETGKK